jgi:hypothetical protein
MISEEQDEPRNTVVVVAVPAVDDPIWDASSEKAPHLTVLYFGDAVAAADIGYLKGVVGDLAAMMQPFDAAVLKRDTLGDDNADVLMVDPGKQMLDVRSQMLADHTVKVMFDAVDQYPKWTPHVTLGYPDTPANGEPGDTIRFDRLAVWSGDYEGEEYPMGAGMTASTHWVPFAMTASAGICAPLEDLDYTRVRVCLPLSERDASSLVVENVVGHDLYVPLLDLGTIDEFTTLQQERLMEVLEALAMSRSQSLPADLGIEYGNTDGVLWNRPEITGYDALRARLIAELATNSIPFSRALPSPVLEFAYIGDNPVPDYLADITPERVYFDRLGLQVGPDFYEYPFGMLGSAAPMTAGGLVVDGDAISSFGEMEAPEVTHDENSGKGSRFRIPLLVPEGVPTGDGRRFKQGALTTRDLPIPLMWQIKTSDGHDGSVVVGRIDTIDRIDAGLGNAYGVFDTGPYGREAERMVREKMLRGVSADLDQFEAVAEQPEAEMSGDGEDVESPESRAIKAAEILVSKARVMGVTIVAKPAFQECFIEMMDNESEEEPLVADGIYMDTLAPSDAEALVACAMVASHIPTNPPSSWFDNPRLPGPTPLTVDDDGRVFGHIAAWHVDHIGLPFGTRPPRSRSGYAYFHTGVVRTAESKDIPVGQLTLAGGHASLELGAHDAVKHYDDTASAVADVHAGEDAYGIWVAGGLRPGTTPEQIRVLRASAPSGDWRPVQGRLELVAVCQVNVPGFPIARARVASGYVTALVAAGASAIAELRGSSVDDRIAHLETELRRDRAREDAALVVSRFHRTDELASTGVTNFRAYSKETLEEYAKKGWAHKNKDGHISYPIADVADLRRAIRAYGRASKEDKPAIRKHIMKRARGLDRPDLIPEQWMTAASTAARIELSRTSPNMEVVADGAYAMTASLRYKRPIDFKDTEHPRDERGKFRKVLFRLQDDLKGKTGTKKAMEEADAAIAADAAGDTKGAHEAGERLKVELDKIAANTVDLQDQEDLKRNGALLGEVLARLPMPQGDTTAKMRFSDLPVALRDLINDLLDRLSNAVSPEVYDEVAGPMANYISGADYMHSDEIQSHLSRIMRYLI